jgi:hypothetical protein
MDIHVQTVDTKVSSVMVKIVVILEGLPTEGTWDIHMARRVLTNLYSYIEWLEGERSILSLGLQEACRRLIAANVWPRESLPRIGRSLSTYEMLATLGLMQGSKDQNLESAQPAREDPGRMEWQSPHLTKHAPGKQALDSNSYQHTYTPVIVNHGVPGGEPSRLQTSHHNPPSFQSTAAALASSSSSVDAGSSWMVLTETSLPRSSWPVSAPTIPQGSRAVAPDQDGQLWRYTTDAWQDVSGPSNLRNRTYPVFPGAQGVRRYENVSRHGSGNPPGMHEAITSEQDETPPDSDGDRSEYIRIPF